TWVWLGGSVAVVVGLLAGWRVVAAVLAWALAIVEAVRLAGEYPQSPVHFLHALPLLVLEVTVAAALTARNPRRAALSTLGRRGVVWFTGRAVVLLLGPMLDPALTPVHTFTDGWLGVCSGAGPALFPRF